MAPPLVPETPEHGGEGGQCPSAFKERGKGGKVASLCCLVIEVFSQFPLSFVLLSSLLENGEFHKVSDRQSNEVLEHLLYFIRSSSDDVENTLLFISFTVGKPTTSSFSR